jgi:hypothetical protein
MLYSQKLNNVYSSTKIIKAIKEWNLIKYKNIVLTALLGATS